MKTFKYYKIPIGETLPQIDDVEKFDYATVGNKKIVGVKAENHSQFESEVENEIVQFADVKEQLDACHLSLQINKTISDRVKLKYSIDDEIAMIKKADDDADKIAYNLYVENIKTEELFKKVAYGLKG